MMSLRAVVEPEPPPESDTSRTKPDNAEIREPDEAPIRTLPSRNGLKVESVALTILAVVAGVAALYLASGLFIPIVLTLLVTAALEPFVKGVERIGIPRWLASAIAVVGLIAAIGGGVGAVVAAELGAGTMSLIVGAITGIVAGTVAELVQERMHA